jgi:hypothetical protein
MNHTKLIPEKSRGHPALFDFLGRGRSALFTLLHRSEGLGGDIQKFFLSFNQTIDAALE